MKHPGDKGSFSTDIGDDILQEAMKAVDKHRDPTKVAKELADEAARAKKAAEDAAKAAEDAARAAQEAEAQAAQAAAGGPAPSNDEQAKEIETLKAELELSMARGRDLMGKLKDEHEKMLRAVADLENFKKRAQKEKEEVLKFGIEKLLKDFLPVFDNFDRALDAAKGAADYDSFRKGVEMIRKLFEDTLGKHQVKAFSAKGQAFDPNRHEAMTAAETTDMPPNHVFSEVLRGFTLNDRLVRPALVVVSKAPAVSEKPAESAPPEGDGPK